jgi:branched-chain amino acid transport system ATP-binding protein
MDQPNTNINNINNKTNSNSDNNRNAGNLTTGGPPTLVLRASGLSKTFGGVTAVNDISFDLFRGEILGLIGPNGAGKTTLLNMINGLIKPSKGRLSFNGREMNRLKPHQLGQLGLARTFQIVRPFQNMTVAENVAVGAFFGGPGGQRTYRQAIEKAESVMELVGLASKRGYYADQLTISDLKRLELAKAMATEPQVLLLDEVMAGLRGREINEAIELIRAINQAGVTILVIEHVIKVIVSLCHRVVVLDYGKKIAEGTPQEIINNPAVIQAYLGQRYATEQARLQAEADYEKGL